MDEKLVEEVKKNFVGYLDPDFNEIFQRSNTLNEMLHICHSYIMNNEERFTFNRFNSSRQ